MGVAMKVIYQHMCLREHLRKITGDNSIQEEIVLLESLPKLDPQLLTAPPKTVISSYCNGKLPKRRTLSTQKIPMVGRHSMRVLVEAIWKLSSTLWSKVSM